MLYNYLNITLIYTTNVSILFHITFKTLSVYTNYHISKIVMECFHVYLYNTPIFAQSSLRQGTLSTYQCVIKHFSNDTQ